MNNDKSISIPLYFEFHIFSINARACPKVSAIRKEVRRVFFEEENDAWTTHVCGYTMQENLFALLQA
jgi:hypothetical protein